MKIIRWVSNWGSLYILAAILIGALYWVQSLHLSTSADDILSIALLVAFGYIVSAWIDHHETNFTDHEITHYRVELENLDCRQAIHEESRRLN